MADEESEEARRLARMAIEQVAVVAKKGRPRVAHLSVLERVLRLRRRQERAQLTAAINIRNEKVRKYRKVLEASLAVKQHRRGPPWLQLALRFIEIGTLVEYPDLCWRMDFEGMTSRHRSALAFELSHIRAFGLAKAAGDRWRSVWLTAAAADWQEVARRNLLWRFPAAWLPRTWHKKDGLDGDELLAKWIAHAYPFVRAERNAPWLHLPEGHEEQDELWIPPRLRGHRLLQVPRRRSDRLID